MDKKIDMIYKIRDIFRFLLGYCSECGEYFKYFKKDVRSNYSAFPSIYYSVCKDCAKKMNKMTDYEWFEYHLTD